MDTSETLAKLNDKKNALQAEASEIQALMRHIAELDRIATEYEIPAAKQTDRRNVLKASSKSVDISGWA